MAAIQKKYEKKTESASNIKIWTDNGNIFRIFLFIANEIVRILCVYYAHFVPFF